MIETTLTNQPISTAAKPNSTHWWGRHRVALDKVDLWQIGPLRLWAENLATQWRFSWAQGDNWLEPNLRFAPNVSDELPPKGCQVVNCVFGAATKENLLLTPQLADRNFVTRLEAPMRVVPGEQVKLYVVTPLWVRVELAEPVKRMLETAVFRPSDSWFGPPGEGGELCYSSQTPAYLHLERVPLRLHCAITAVQIRNLGGDALTIDRVNIPLPKLSLFCSPTSGFWTDRISLVRNQDDQMASLEISQRPPEEAGETQFMSGPREGGGSGAMRAFSSLFKERSQL